MSMLILSLMTIAVTCGCSARPAADDLEGEVTSAFRSTLPADAMDVQRGDREDGFWSASWSWRFTTSTPAAPYREQLVAKLAPRFRCDQERRRVRCARLLDGDRLHLELQAHPHREGTLVKATLTATPY